jgi:hypothetical protein
MPCLRALLVFLSLTVFSAPAFSTVWHIRTDGGSQTQCTGKANAAYPGTGTAQACAFNHPFWLLDQGSWAWMIAGGDTVQFEDQGPYYLGLGPSKGLGTSWPHCAGNSSDCVLPQNIPSGTAANPTRFLGKNARSCGTNYTVLSGIQGTFWLMNVQGTNWVDLECIEFTQGDHCSKLGQNPTNITSTQMNGGTATFGWTKGYYNPPKVGEPVTITGTTNGGGVFNVTNKVITSLTGDTSGTFTIAGLSGTYPQQAETGSSDFAGYCHPSDNFATNGLVFAYTDAQGPSNMTIKDLYIHGIAGDGTLGSHFNTAATDTFNATNIRIFGNGLAGFDSDGGGCSTNCESTGTMNLTNLDVEWNGCIQISPGVYSFCVDQAYGGNGDNLVMIASGGTWNWNHVTSKFGMQDCFDSLHSGDDPNNLPNINTNYMYSEGCEGAAIKMGGGNMTLRNSVGISNCQAMLTASNFPNNLPGWNSFVGSPCRANDSFVFTFSDGHTITIQNVDNIGQQGVAWDFGANANGCNGACVIVFQNNTTVGFVNTASGQSMSAFFYEFPVDPFANPSSRLTNNNWFNLRSGCPANATYEKNAVCADPLFVAEADVNHINPHLTSKSPLIGAGVYVAATSPDYDGDIRPTTAESIGFDEFAAAPPASANPTKINGATRTEGGAVIH